MKKMMMNSLPWKTAIALTGLGVPGIAQMQEKPNILFVISDDQSWPYASAYDTKGISTPAFDRVAAGGVLFTSAFVTSPGCSPSRASILTGRYPWQLEEAGTHASSFPLKYKTFTQVLEENGYAVGFTGKPWGPGDWKVSGWLKNPVGKEYNEKKESPPWKGISDIDYAGNFDFFLESRKPGQPFFFWLGTHEPHRNFEEGSGVKSGKAEKDLNVPGFLPDNQTVRSDMLDYFLEIEWFDTHLGRVLQKLEESGELENTMIIMTSDNGMPFPRAKANCYDAGLRVPMAICWGSNIPRGRVIREPVSTIDLAPTILEAAGCRFDGDFPMTGKSMLPVLRSESKKMGIAGNMAIFAGRERHSSARFGNRGYPQRMIRTAEYLYIRNYHPEFWPAGDPRTMLANGNLGREHSAYFDIDDGPTIRQFKEINTTQPEMALFFLAATAKRPAEELFDIIRDPSCLHNLAKNPDYNTIRKELSAQLTRQLKETGDPRETGPDPEIWETYPRLSGPARTFPK